MPSPKLARSIKAGPLRSAGFTLLELSIVVAMLAVIASMAVPKYQAALAVARYEIAVREVNLLMNEIDRYAMREGALPLTLADIDRGGITDPWANPYQYVNFATLKGKGNGGKRKDRFLVPINSDYDLCSMGPDGRTTGPLTAKNSRDDIIRASDGDYIGVASKY